MVPDRGGRHAGTAEETRRGRSDPAHRRSGVDLRDRPAHQEPSSTASPARACPSVSATTRAWFPEIDHWKATIFAGQGIVTFGSANYTPFELYPTSPRRQLQGRVGPVHRMIRRSSPPSRRSSTGCGTTRRSSRRAGSPARPYFKNWDDACVTEGAPCADYRTRYPNPAPMVIDTRRLEPDDAMPPDMVWGQGSSFNNRLVTEINDETRRVDLVIYRLTVPNITQALLNKHAGGRAGAPDRRAERVPQPEVARVLADARQRRSPVGGGRPDQAPRAPGADPHEDAGDVALRHQRLVELRRELAARSQLLRAGRQQARDLPGHGGPVRHDVERQRRLRRLLPGAPRRSGASPARRAGRRGWPPPRG